MNAAPILETERLILRPHVRADIDEVARLWADPAVVRHISGEPATRAESWARLLRYVGHWPLMGFGYWVATEKESGRFLGEVGVADFRRSLAYKHVDSPEAGWAFQTNAQCKGYAHEAVACVLGWADVNLDAEQTFCMIAPDNAASLRLAEKVGYVADQQVEYLGHPVLVHVRARP